MWLDREPEYDMILHIGIVAPTMEQSKRVLDEITEDECNIVKRKRFELIGDNYRYKCVALSENIRGHRFDQLIVVNKSEVLANDSFYKVVLPTVRVSNLPECFEKVYKVQYYS